jgi:hypothetical protein
MAEPGAGCRNQTELFSLSKAGSVSAPADNARQFKPKGREIPNRFAASNSRLGDAAINPYTNHRLKADYTGSLLRLGASPHQRFEGDLHAARPS